MTPTRSMTASLCSQQGVHFTELCALFLGKYVDTLSLVPQCCVSCRFFAHDMHVMRI